MNTESQQWLSTTIYKRDIVSRPTHAKLHRFSELWTP